MKKLPQEQPKTEINTPFEIETKISKEVELDPNRLPLEELDALVAAMRLLAKNKNAGFDTGTLEIKIDPTTGEKSAIVYRNSDHAPVFMTNYPPEINYLKNPDMVLEQLEIENERRRATNKFLKDITSGKAETDKES